VLLLPFKFYNITFSEFLYEFLRIILISENSLKLANFFAEVTNSRSMNSTSCPVPPVNQHHLVCVVFQMSLMSTLFIITSMSTTRTRTTIRSLPQSIGSCSLDQLSPIKFWRPLPRNRHLFLRTNSTNFLSSVQPSSSK